MSEFYPNSANTVSIVDQSYTDIDKQAACLDNYEQRYHQITAGNYSGHFKTLTLGEKVGLYFETCNQVLDQWGSVPPNQYSLLMLMNPSKDILINNNTIGLDDIYFSTPGHSFEGRCPAGTHVCVLSLEKKFFDTFYNNYLPLNQSIELDHKSNYVDNNKAKTHLLRQMVLETVLFAQDSSSIKSYDSVLRSLQTSLVSLTAGFVADKISTNTKIKTLDTPKSNLAISCRDLIRDCEGKDITIDTLVESSQVSRRTIENSFIQTFEVSPAAYIKRVQLNEIRTALRMESNHAVSIGDIVSEWGIWHLSRFAKQYKNQFGELPSETRSKSYQGIN